MKLPKINWVELLTAWTSLIATAMISSNTEITKYGFIIGLIGQVFWLALAIQKRMYFILIMGFVYAIIWINGIYQYFY